MLTRRGKIWYVRFEYLGRKVYKSTRTTNREEAEQVEAKLKRDIWRQASLGEKRKYSWQEAVVRFVKEKQNHRSINDMKRHLRFFSEPFMDVSIDKITRDWVDDILDEKQDSDGISNATRNRYTATLRGLINTAYREWEWLESAPIFRILEEKTTEPRWLTYAEAERLIAHAPDYLKNPIALSLNTGIRKSNCLCFKWEWVDLDNRTAYIPMATAKAKRTIPIPLNDDAIDIIKSQIGKHPIFLFTNNNGEPFSEVHSEVWKKLITAAKIEPFRWHDLRHTWASWHVRNGTSLTELMELGGWSSYRMIQRYAHLNTDHLHESAQRIRAKSVQAREASLKNKKR